MYFVLYNSQHLPFNNYSSSFQILLIVLPNPNNKDGWRYFMWHDWSLGSRGTWTDHLPLYYKFKAQNKHEWTSEERLNETVDMKLEWTMLTVLVFLDLLTRNWLDHRKWALQTVLPDWAVLYLIVQGNIGLGGWTKFGLVWGQFGSFKHEL